jgi:hypothetical protein
MQADIWFSFIYTQEQRYISDNKTWPSYQVSEFLALLYFNKY